MSDELAIDQAFSGDATKSTADDERHVAQPSAPRLAHGVALSVLVFGEDEGAEAESA